MALNTPYHGWASHSLISYNPNHPATVSSETQLLEGPVNH